MTTLDGLRLIDPQCYAEHGYPHELWTELRRESPVHFFDLAGWPSFWAVTKHADIVEISKQPEIFLNGPGMTLVRDRGQDPADQQQIRTVISMDPPEHRKYRALAGPFFSPRALRQLDSLVTDTARSLVDGFGREGECDFVTEIASQHPLKIIARILGVAESDEPMILKLTNELFGNEDPEFQRSEDRMAGIRELFAEFWIYFTRVMEDRRDSPRDDLASVFANARIDGKPMASWRRWDTASSRSRPGTRRPGGRLEGDSMPSSKIRRCASAGPANPSSHRRAADEIIRFVTPVNVPGFKHLPIRYRLAPAFAGPRA